jgi:hypothetical protein
MRFAHSFLMYCGILLLAVSMVMIPQVAMAEGGGFGGGDDEDNPAAPCTDANCAGCTAPNVGCPKSGALPCSCACNGQSQCRA